MTKSEAVIWLEKLKEYCQGAEDWADFSKECEALDIAIEELRREQPEPPEDGPVVGGVVAACNQPETKLGVLEDGEETKKFVDNADDWAVIPARCPMCDGDVTIGLRPLQAGEKRHYACPHCGKIFTKTVDSVSTDSLNKRAEIKFTDGSHCVFVGGLVLYEKYPGELADRMK